MCCRVNAVELTIIQIWSFARIKGNPPYPIHYWAAITANIYYKYLHIYRTVYYYSLYYSVHWLTYWKRWNYFWGSSYFFHHWHKESSLRRFTRPPGKLNKYTLIVKPKSSPKSKSHIQVPNLGSKSQIQSPEERD